MNESLENRGAGRIRAALPHLCDVLFGVWLFTEVGMEHTVVSRVCMLLFAGAVLLWMCLERKAFFSYWMPASLALILWGAIGARAFSAHPDASMHVVRTLCINFVFLFFLYQYFLLRRDMNRVFTAYIISAGVLTAYILLADRSFDLELGRFGMDLGINPNWVGVLLCVAFALSLHRGLFGKWQWLFAAALFALGVALTKSTKAYVLVFILLLVVVLLRRPKRWGLKLLVLLGASWVLFAFVLAYVPLFNWIDTFFLQRIRYVYENLFLGWNHENSLSVRQGLAAVGRDAFLARPLTGCGLDGFRFLAGAEGVYSHNNYIELAVCGGIPMLLLYYAPQLLALARGAGRLRGNAVVQMTFVFALCSLLMDVGMVSYVDRTLLMIPLMLMAATRVAAVPEKDGDRSGVWKTLKNPYRIVQWCSTRGKLKNMDDERYLKLLYRGCTGKKLNLHPPVTFNEKQQWMKLHDHNPVYHTLADKLAVRGYVAAKVGGDCLVPLLGAWDSVEEIDFFALPARFALKCTHDSGSFCLCADKSAFDAEEAKTFLRARLKKNYYTAGREWPYKGLRPRVMAEAFIGKPDGTPPDDYKLYCFDGVCRAILLCTNRTRHGVNYLYFDRDFNLYPINHETVAAAKEGKAYERPKRLDGMLALAERLASGFRFMRVDLYQADETVYFGEMTLFDNSGFATDLTGEGDRILGEFLQIEEEPA